MKQSDKDLKAMAICTMVALLATPIVYQIVFAPMGWWM